jgi:hypothetical protein
VQVGRYVLYSAAIAAVLFIGLVAVFGLPRDQDIAAPPTASASPTASAITQPTATASPPATASPNAATSPGTGGKYVSTVGYSIEVVPPWHLSTCIEPYRGVDRSGEDFVPVPAREEMSSDIGSRYPRLAIFHQPNPQNLTPRQWIEGQGRAGFSGSTSGQLEDVTYAGRPAVRKSVEAAPGVYHYAVANGDRMYIVSTEIRPPLDPSLPTSLARMIDSFQFISDAERAAAHAALPPPPAPRTPEQVADGLAAAFAAKNINALAGLSAPCMFRFGEQAGGTTWTREKYLDDLRAAFASGLTITVEPRPINRDRGEFDAWIAATWRDPQDPKGPQPRKVVLRREPNDNWRWAGTLEIYR